MAISRERFKEQLTWLNQVAQFCSLAELIKSPPDTGIRVAISFDDGYQCLVNDALPIMNKLQISGTVFINSGWMGEVNSVDTVPSQGHYPGEKFLRWNEIDLLLKNGWEIGSHGVNHLDLTTSNEKTVYRELADSKIDIEKKTGQACKYFAYTWGKNNKYLIQAVEDAGYTHAFSGVHAPLSGKDNSYSLPRIDVRREYTMEDFKSLIYGDWDYLGYKQRLMKLLK